MSVLRRTDAEDEARTIGAGTISSDFRWVDEKDADREALCKGRAGKGHDVSLRTSENCFFGNLGESFGAGRAIGAKGVGRFFGGTRGLFKARSIRDGCDDFENIGLIPSALSLALAGDVTD